LLQSIYTPEVYLLNLLSLPIQQDPDRSPQETLPAKHNLHCSGLSCREGSLELIAKWAPGHCPGHPADHFSVLEPDIAASLAPDNSAACKTGPAFPAYIDEDFSISSADLQRDEAASAFGITTAESTDVAAHFALLSGLLLHLSMAWGMPVPAKFKSRFISRRYADRRIHGHTMKLCQSGCEGANLSKHQAVGRCGHFGMVHSEKVLQAPPAKIPINVLRGAPFRFSFLFETGEKYREHHKVRVSDFNRAICRFLAGQRPGQENIGGRALQNPLYSNACQLLFKWKTWS
jgi:hypothetical protein